MTWFYAFVQRRWQALLLLLLAVGFASTAVDLLLAGHVEGVAFLGVVAPAVAFVCVMIGLFAGRTMRGAMAVVLLFVALAGLLGAWQHFEAGRRSPGGGAPVLLARQGASQAVRYAPALAAQGGSPLAQPRRGRRDGPSPLMPLVMSGLALMAAILLLVQANRRG
jgi:hypothetical protein